MHNMNQAISIRCPVRYGLTSIFLSNLFFDPSQNQFIGWLKKRAKRRNILSTFLKSFPSTV